MEGWERFTFYHGQCVGWRKGNLTIIPTNGRRGSWDLLEDDEWVGETFSSPEAAAAWA